MENTQVALQVPTTLTRKILSALGWITVGLVLLITFTFLKLPQDRIRNLIQSTISSSLAARGATFSFEEGSLTLGLSYTMKGITLTFPDADGSYHIEKIEVSPSLIPLIIGKLGGSFKVENAGGYVNGSFAIKSGLADVHFNAKSLDLGKLGVFALASGSGVKANALVSGDGNVSGDFNIPSSLEGTVTLKLDHVVLDQQMLMGFSIPRIAISEGNFDFNMEHGKLAFKTLKLGKSSADDIQASATGEMVLGRSWDSCTVNLKTHFSFSESVSKAFVILDALLAQGKQADGSFAYQLTGPFNAINAQPLPSGST